MLSPTVLADETGRQIDLLHVCPADVKRHLEEGLQRWQSQRILAYFADSAGESCWLRAMRAAVSSIANPARRGALRALWAAACWPPVRLFAINKRGDDKCFVCKNAVGTYAHHWFGCPGMLQERDEQDCSFLPPEILERRAEIIDQHANVNGAAGVECFYLSYGLPPLPPFPPDVEPSLEIFGWGDWSGAWGRRIFTDGSGLASGVAGLTRCGWAVVEISDSGLPLRALYGPLPGRVQTVPRAEYYVVAKGLEVAAKPAHVISDHLSLVRHGQNWGPHNEQASSTHANVWRRVHVLYPTGRPTLSEPLPFRSWLMLSPTPRPAS